MTDADDQFQMWLMDMDEAIERFRHSVSDDVAQALDFTPESLVMLERVVLTKYSCVDEIIKPGEAKIVDGMARYVGQVFRRKLGGKWMIDYSDEKNAFYGLPQLVGMSGQRTQICPLTLVTASTDRRTGSFIRTVFDNNAEDAL
jgi:hypothetical protein